MKKVISVFFVVLSVFLMGNAYQDLEINIEEEVFLQEQPILEYEDILLFKIDNPYAKAEEDFVLLDPDNMDVTPVIKNDRTLVPVRFISENLGFDVSWDSKERRAVMSKDDISISCKTDSYEIYVNEKRISLDVPSMIINDRLYVPLRAVSEVFDNNVSYKKRMIMVSQSDTSIEQYEIEQLSKLYSEFVKIKKLQEFREDENSMEKWKLSKRLIDHIVYFHDKTIPSIEFNYFPDHKDIPQEVYYHAHLAVFLDLVKVESGDFDAYYNLSFDELNKTLENFVDVFIDNPDFNYKDKNNVEEDILNIINKNIKDIKDEHNIRASVYDFSKDLSISYNGTEKFYPASLTKTLNLLCFLEEVQAGNLDLESIYKLEESDKFVNDSEVIGAGNLRFEDEGTEYTYRSILNRMVSSSDNVAANITIDILGIDKINSFSKRFELEDTIIYRKFYEMNVSKAVNHSTTVDLNKMLILLENRLVVNDDLSSLGIEFMKETYNKDRIARYAPDNVTVANKIGFLQRLSGDMAIIYFENREPIALTVFVEDKYRRSIKTEEVNDIIGNLSGEIIDYFSLDSMPSLYINGDRIDKNAGLRFIDKRPFIKYHEFLGEFPKESVVIGGEKYISLDCFAENTEYSYLLRRFPLNAVSIR
ncbi:serine hydrolase [Herbivorax sp. ANBcel31]|uniref:serine hydrolase n=1 Tax=Herbivorax sp. ANBcel31 TaxID=3069754 RepID=UPI0027B82426|nr:serine hydrolase [Herbivorax sp. ANBcel31]MDQ2087194.1 serine hydrolase [Herbivorax sp. ANBcel31]